jgi:IS5 family transposase
MSFRKKYFGKLGPGERHQLRNKLISKLRSPGERPHEVIKRFLGAGRVLVTTVKRVYAKMMVTAFAYNLYQLCTLKNAKII